MKFHKATTRALCRLVDIPLFACGCCGNRAYQDVGSLCSMSMSLGPTSPSTSSESESDVNVLEIAVNLLSTQDAMMAALALNY
ncbi:hypothetical protein TNIN_20531 [Trichonephila inaurata madagascariensis]|uniref:Uncharacterized protein n=1 Tax=Trichonephila inaurata madagascariensis TaxID=2747483 RepID=A0A8X6YLN8_9ARAC|nr:hypothetical protein TNIN_20531 [Trichonephila inaurata madagascariensis]